MDFQPINLKQKLTLFSDQWAPRVIAKMNESHFKLAKIQGEFVWHRHLETDEVFIALEGEMAIEFRDGRVELKAGEMVVVPRGVEHKPVAENECAILLIEPAGTVNTGDAGGDRTVTGDIWI